MEYTKEQLKAAYALNLCTISISQIIDYDDVNIMEQEYDAILNNLNLEQMPKDEALLKVLKQLLDTITFFRISEKEREFIEKGYQMKMKNAIWSSVPNIGMVVAGGTWWTAAIAIASQIGIGYMNYRRAKAEGEFEKEKQLWQLERSAIEQFNGLRRELFDTAWRLSAAYNYPDELRLTERQIKQYNAILMDNDPIRRYERLSSIKDQFIAYPPFWYYLGHTAEEIASTVSYISEENRIALKLEAINHFCQYRESNQQGLLREDPIASACALELTDLLDPIKDHDFIMDLTEEAYAFSGRKEDILQLCAMTYLRIKENERAAKILKELVNEDYIPYMNAQILSSIYVEQYINKKDLESADKYRLLERQIGSQYLFPMPIGIVEKASLNAQFIYQQQQMLIQKYSFAIRQFSEKSAGQYAKIIPLPTKEGITCIDYYSMPDEERKDLFNQIKAAFDNSGTAEKYGNTLKEVDVTGGITDCLNNLLDAVSELIFVDDALRSVLAGDLEKAIIIQRDSFNALLGKLVRGKFDFADLLSLLQLEYKEFTDKFYSDLAVGMKEYVNSISEMQDFAIAEQNLNEFCTHQRLDDPDKLFSHIGTLEISTATSSRRKISTDLWRSSISQFSQEAQRKINLMRTIEKRQGLIITDPNKAVFYSAKDPRLNRYFSSNGKLYNIKGLKQRTIAVLDAKGKNGGFDLVFTDSGIIPYRDGNIKPEVLYKDIHWKDNSRQELVIGDNYRGYVADLEQIYSMIQELKQNSFVPTTPGVPIWDAIIGALGINKQK